MAAHVGVALCPVPPADASALGYVGTSLVAAGRKPRSMLCADPSFLGNVAASFLGAYHTPLFRPVPRTHASSHSVVGASFAIAFRSHLLSPVPFADTSNLRKVIATLMAASFS